MGNYVTTPYAHERRMRNGLIVQLESGVFATFGGQGFR